MRYVFALTALALSAIFIIFGIGQITFLAIDDRVSAEIRPDTSVHYSVIPGEVLAAQPGQPSISVADQKWAFVGFGSLADVETFVKPFDHEVFAFDAETNTLVGSIVGGVVPTLSAENAIVKTSKDFQDPSNSDLWRIAAAGDGKQTITIEEDRDALAGTAVIIASNGENPQPARASFAWLKNPNLPLVGPFIVTGLFFALVGLVLYLLQVDSDKRRSGPQRGQKGFLLGLRAIARERWRDWQERRSAKKASTVTQPTTDAPETNSGATATRSSRSKALLALGLGATLVISLSGCSPRYWPQPAAEEPEVITTEEAAPGEQETASEVPPVPVTQEQIERIMRNISATSAQADAEANIDLMKTRFSGAAMAQREANYKIRGAVPETPLPLQLTANLLDYELVQSTEGWPRTMLVTVASAYPPGVEAPVNDEGQKLSSAALSLLMTQTSPFTNYMVQSLAEIRGGTVFPQAAAVEVGTTLLPNTLSSLLLSPAATGEAFSKILVEGEAAPNYNLFDIDGDPLLSQMGNAWLTKAQQEATSKNEAVEYRIEVTPADDTVALSTGTGGALVSVTLNEKHIAKSTLSRGSVKLSPGVKALSGLDGAKPSVYQLWQHQMLFYVPSAELNEKIRVLASTTAMTGAGLG